MVIGDQDVFAGWMNAQMRRSGTSLADGIEQGQASAAAIDRVRADRACAPALIVLNLVCRIQVSPRGVECEPGRVGVIREEFALCESSRGRIHLEQVDALSAADAALGPPGRTV